jgi:hypothetical protein
VNRAGPSTYEGVEGDGRMGMRMRMRMGMGMGLRVLELRVLEMRMLELMVGVGHLHLTTSCTHLKTLRWMKMILKWIEVTSFYHHLLVMKRMERFHIILVQSSMKWTLSIQICS